MKYFITCIIVCIFLNLNATEVPEKYHGLWLKATEFNHEEHGRHINNEHVVRFEEPKPILWIVGNVVLWPKPEYPGGFIAIPITDVLEASTSTDVKFILIEFKEFNGPTRSLTIIDTRHPNMWRFTINRRNDDNTVTPLRTYVSSVVPVLLNEQSILRYMKNNE